MEKRLVTPLGRQLPHHTSALISWRKQLPYFLCQQREALGDMSEGFLGWGGRGRGSGKEPRQLASATMITGRTKASAVKSTGGLWWLYFFFFHLCSNIQHFLLHLLPYHCF